ncbi:MAG: formylglycine-generating enzyme family protein [Oculatellaceae cyanobacterium Prado106]|nr:formylglycine-generating enzyme family protein [Oculatellaceae cyanobacterium Prado106]
MPFILREEHRTAQYYSEVLATTPVGNGVANVILEMISIPGGSFLMGSPEEEGDRDNDESPQHPVTVPSFFMGRYPITQLQYQTVMGNNPSNFKGDDRPVESVSWHDATEFCHRLTELTNHPYRLPTEAEWEYACRAGTMTPFHFGETITTDLANYRGTDEKKYNWSGSYGKGPKGIYREETTPVGSFPPNAFGLWDMHGNVWEWCQDHWHDSYEGAPSDGSAWIDSEAEKDANRILRGGSWFYFPRDCRSATRNYIDAGGRGNDIGFRVVGFASRTG